MQSEIISPNCHPFIEADDNNRSWMLIHNGTIFDYPELDKYTDKENGDTDSERILLYIIDKINEFESSKGAPSTIKERFNLLTDIVEDLSKNNKLNLMIYDGDLTYIHSNMRNSLYYLKSDEGFMVASTPLNDDENWKEVELNKLFGLIDGNIIFESEEHENEFIFTEAHQKAIEEFLNKPTNQDKNFIGIEIEIPIINLDKKAVDFDVVHTITDKFQKQFNDFKADGIDYDGNVFALKNPKNEDIVCYDCSYNNIEFAMGREKELFSINERFSEYYAFVKESFEEYNHTLTGMGINPYRKYNINEPIPSERYLMLYHHLKSFSNF